MLGNIQIALAFAHVKNVIVTRKELQWIMWSVKHAN